MTVNDYWHRATQTRVSRRRMLAGSAAASAGAAAVAIAGCGGRQEERADYHAAAIGRCTPHGHDPLHRFRPRPQIETGTGLAIFPRIYGYLLHIDPRDDTIIKDHALSVEQPDPTTYLFKLRPDLRFQDIAPVGGRNVTSEDIAASIVRYRDNPLVTSKTWHTTILDRVEAVDTSTVRVTTRRPYVYSLASSAASVPARSCPKSWSRAARI